MPRRKKIVKVPKVAEPHHGRAYAMFLNLPPEQLQVIETRLARGVGYAALARTLQEEMELFRDIKANTLEKALQRFNDLYLKPRRVQANEELKAEEVNGSSLRTDYKLPPMKERLDVLSKMEELVVIAEKRILKLYKREENSPMPFDTLSKMIPSYGRLLMDLGDLQMETGYMRRAPKKFQGVFGFNAGQSEDGVDDRPTFQIALEAQRSAKKGIGMLTELVGEIIEGEHVRIKSSGLGLPATDSEELPASGGQVSDGTDPSPPRAAGGVREGPAG